MKREVNPNYIPPSSIYIPTPPVKPPHKCKIELVLANDRVWDVYKDGNWIFSRGSWENVVEELARYNF
jgi:hypothetical protein